MLYKNILIDGNNLFWISVIKETTEKVLEDTIIYSNGIRKSLEYIKFLKEKFSYEDTKFYFLFDNPVSIHNLRKQYDSKYKHARDKLNIPKKFYDTLNIFIEILKNYSENYIVVQANYLESDDLTKPIIEKCGYKEKTLIISNDLDWARNITEQVEWFNHKEIIKLGKFKEVYGFEPKGKKIQLYKAIVGDRSDSINAALPYLKKEKVKQIVNDFEDLKEFLKQFNGLSYLNQSDKEKIVKNKIILERNYQLVDFILPDNLDDFITYGIRDSKYLKEIFEIIEIPLEDDMIEKSEDFFVSMKF